MQKALYATFLTLFGLVLTFAPATDLRAQRLSGSATITVLDPSGAAIPAARATVTSKDRGISLESTSGANGVAVFPDLAPGDYNIAVQHDGFKTASTVLSVRVGVNSSLVMNMELGAITTEVMVQAEAVTVDTTKSTVQGVVTANMI